MSGEGDLGLVNLTAERRVRERRRWPNVTTAELLAERAEAHPSGTALEDAEVSLTWGAFRERVARVARTLADCGVAAGDVVAYQLRTSVETVVLHYAIAFAGGVACPISLLHREHDLRHILGTVAPRLTVTHAEYRGVGFAAMHRAAVAEAGLAAPVLVVPPGALMEALGAPDLLKPVARRPDDPCYVVWTSGTTGAPSGVVHTHNTGLCGLERKLRRLGVDGGDALLVAAPLSHHIGIYMMHALALAGVRLVLMESWRAEAALDVIQRSRPTFTLATPTHLIDLVRSPALAERNTSSLRLFSCAGAPVPPSAVEMAQERLPRCRVLSAYGTSEEGYVTSVGPDDPPSWSAASDGRPLDDMEVRVVGAGGQPVPPGVEGDLLVRTPSALAGYARQPELTRTAFAGNGWRWTGDRAVMREDGTVRITGRSKDVIIRGGVNIPVVQVESALLRHPRVAAVAVVAMPDDRLGERACAFVVPRGEAPTLPDLQRALAGEGISPVYWPERLEVVPELPVTASGKVQKFRLREAIARKLAAERGQRGA